MIQPIKQFRVTRLTVSGFKGYADSQTFCFGNMNLISGHMGVGKSSIADAIAFAITGVGFYACAKIDHLYHQKTRDMLVELEFEDENGKTRTLVRRRKNDDTKVTLDGGYVSQSELTIMFGERDLFLSMFNPQYFIDVLGPKGRNLLERYLPEIPKEEVLSQLSDQTRQILDTQEFLSAEDYVKQLRSHMSSLEERLSRIQGQIDLLHTQQKDQAQELLEKQAQCARVQERIGELEKRRITGFHGGTLEEKRADLYAQYEELQKETPAIANTGTLDAQIQAVAEKLAGRKAASYQSKYAAPMSDAAIKLKTLETECKRIKYILDGLKAGIQCPTCLQTITEQTLPQVKQEFAASLLRVQTEGQQLTAQFKEIQGLDAKAKAVFEQYRQEDITAGEAALEELKAQRTRVIEQAEQQRTYRQEELSRLHSEIQSVELDLECGMLSHEETEELNQLRNQLVELNAQVEVLSRQAQASPAASEKQEQEIASIQREIKEKKEILSALSFFISKRVEINFSKLKMNRVAISLYDVVKTTGEVKAVFRFTYQDRDYICLSHSEKIRAGLEVAELIKRLLGVQYPTFIDDVESVPVIDNVRPTGQVFIAKVVKGASLRVQVNDAAPAKAA